MTALEDVLHTLNWLLDTPESDSSGLNPIELRLPWHLEMYDSKVFEAELPPDSKKFTIRISNSVWPRLEAFCGLGIQWEAKARRPRRKAFDYSAAEWQTVIQLTQDNVEWSKIEASVLNLRANSDSNKLVVIPISLHARNGVKVHTAAAYYGFFWLICHEAVHAWKQHYKLAKMAFRQSIQDLSPMLAGGELDRTYESDADWESVKLLFAHTLNCILGGYKTALAYAAGFGIAAATLMLNPCRHNLWDQAIAYDPGWMRSHFIEEAAKAGYWSILRSRYPGYNPAPFRFEGHGRKPSSRFNEKSDKAHEAFGLGQFDALAFARAISDANQLHHLVDPEPFKFGEPDEWKDFQIMVMDTAVLNRRRMACKMLNRLLPADPRFKGFALGHGASLKMNYLAGVKRSS
jgi:hypothetical protein